MSRASRALSAPSLTYGVGLLQSILSPLKAYWNDLGMTPDNIVFHGLDGVECEDFVYQIERLAIKYDKVDDDAWKAKHAVARLAGGALRWYDRYTRLISNANPSWVELRQAMFDEWKAPDPEQRLQYTTTHNLPSNPFIAPTSPAVTPVVTPRATRKPQATMVQPSDQVHAYHEGKFNIRVIASKIRYSGFISKIFANDEYGRMCCTLTAEQPEAAAIGCHALGLSPVIIPKTASVLGMVNYPTLRQERSDWTSATLALSDVMGMSHLKTRDDTAVQDGETPPKESTASTRRVWALDPSTGRLTPGDAESPQVAVIGRTPDGKLTLFFWERRIWDEADGAYEAELYLIRAN